VIGASQSSERGPIGTKMDRPYSRGAPAFVGQSTENEISVYRPSRLSICSHHIGKRGQGLAVYFGAPGVGKTVLIQKLIQQYSPKGPWPVHPSFAGLLVSVPVKNVSITNFLDGWRYRQGATAIPIVEVF